MVAMNLLRYEDTCAIGLADRRIAEDLHIEVVSTKATCSFFPISLSAGKYQGEAIIETGTLRPVRADGKIVVRWLHVCERARYDMFAGALNGGWLQVDAVLREDEPARDRRVASRRRSVLRAHRV